MTEVMEFSAEIIARGENLLDRYGDYAMHVAAGINAINILEWLKSQGADVNAGDAWNRTPMHDAAKTNSLDSLDWLKSQGADVNAMADHDGTPMQYAEWLNSRDSLKWFMDNDGIETITKPDETPQPV